VSSAHSSNINDKDADQHESDDGNDQSGDGNTIAASTIGAVATNVFSSTEASGLIINTVAVIVTTNASAGGHITGRGFASSAVSII